MLYPTLTYDLNFPPFSYTLVSKVLRAHVQRGVGGASRRFLHVSVQSVVQSADPVTVELWQ